MGSLLDKAKAKILHPKRLRRNNQEVRHQGFPIKRKKRDEYHVFMGFPTQDAAEEWIAWGVKDNFLRQPMTELRKVEPGKPKKP